MSDQPNKPFDPRVPQPETPAQPPAEPPTVFEATPAAPTPTPVPAPPAAPVPPPAYSAPPVAPPVAPAPPPAYSAPPVAPPVAPAPPTTPSPAVPTPPSVAPAYSAPPLQPAVSPPATNPYAQPPAMSQAPGHAAPQFAAASHDATPAGSSGGRGRGPIIAIGVVLIAAIAGVGALVLSQGGDDTAMTAPTSVPVATLQGQTTSTTSTGDGEAASSLPPAIAASVAELAESTVQIIMLDGDVPLCSGSGTIIDELGTILTNAHVIEPGGACPYDRIGIAVTGDAGLPPELLYLADVYAYDPVVDLAVVRIATDLDGAAVAGPFRAVPVGDSDAVEIGDQLRILGYPGIGGDTVTFTNGVVSGFASQNGIGQRSWIKTDATIAGGNSGGAGFDDEGRLVGVPTQASASSSGEIVDCRVITDTNGDGQLDGDDQCVPIGGFLNGLRPVNLAIPLIDQAASGGPISIQDDVTPPSSAVNTADIFVFNPGWTVEASDDAGFQPDFIRTASGGPEKLCLWFDWRSIPDGAQWDGVWQVDGVVNEGFSFFSEEWASGETGEKYWLCAIEPTGLASGLYEFIFYVAGDVIFYESFEVTDTPKALHEITFVNNTGERICYLYVAPFGAANTGLDELGAQEFFEAGASRVVSVPEGSIIADAYDCDFNPIYQQYDGQVVTGPATVEITG